MASKLLFAPCSSLDRTSIEQAIAHGVDVRILDCFDDMHSLAHTRYPNRTIHVPAHRMSVKSAVQYEAIDVAVVREDPTDFVKYALLTQTLRDAQVQHVIVICSEASRVALYRRCGAHQVLIDDGTADVWQVLQPHLVIQVPAS